MKDTNLIDSATRATSKRKTATRPTVAVEVQTPAESVKLAGEFGVKFSDATDLWIIRGKTGQVRLADKSVIAVCLLSKATKYPTGKPDDVRATLKGYRKTWTKLTPEKKNEWMNKAQKVFTPARKEYHATVKPLAALAVRTACAPRSMITTPPRRCFKSATAHAAPTRKPLFSHGVCRLASGSVSGIAAAWAASCCSRATCIRWTHCVLTFLDGKQQTKGVT